MQSSVAALLGIGLMFGGVVAVTPAGALIIDDGDTATFNFYSFPDPSTLPVQPPGAYALITFSNLEGSGGQVELTAYDSSGTVFFDAPFFDCCAENIGFGGRDAWQDQIGSFSRD
jgi:hypothetical protein